MPPECKVQPKSDDPLCEQHLQDITMRRHHISSGLSVHLAVCLEEHFGPEPRYLLSKRESGKIFPAGPPYSPSRISPIVVKIDDRIDRKKIKKFYIYYCIRVHIFVFIGQIGQIGQKCLICAVLLRVVHRSNFFVAVKLLCCVLRSSVKPV